MSKPLAATLIILGVIGLMIGLAGCAVPQEQQGWQNADSHLHVSWADERMNNLGTLDEAVDLKVTVLFHNNPGTLTFVRWSDYSDVRQRVDTDWTPGGDQHEARLDVNLRIDPAQFAASGWREVRITANRGEPEREFTTSRLCLFVKNGKSRSDNCNTGPEGDPQSAGRCGGGAWYPEPEYRIAFIDCRDMQTMQTRELQGGDRIRVKGQDGPLTVTLDPAFHASPPNPGRELLRGGSANTWHTVTIPSDLSPGVHTLHSRAMASNGEAGVHVQKFCFQTCGS
jgi:hypothetical protein